MSFISKTLSAAAVAVAMIGAAAPASAQSTQTIRIDNRSGVTLYRFYASPVSNSSWEQDLLGNTVVPSGRIQPITFRNVRDCNYDFLFEMSNGVQFTDVVNICQIGTYTLRP